MQGAIPADREAATGAASDAERKGGFPTIGMLWGDFPWGVPAGKLGKLLSWGVVARNVTRALGKLGTVVPYVPPDDATPEAHRAALAAFLGAVDVVWADCYPGSTAALRLRHEFRLPCRVVLFAGGTLPKGAEAMLFPWQELLRPGDQLLFTCEADQGIWRRLVRRSDLREWVVPLAVDETVFSPSDATTRAATRSRYGLAPETPLLLYVGRLNIQKNLHSLLRMLAAVRRKAPDARLFLVGEEDDIGLAEFGVHNTGYVRWLRTLAEDLGVADAITFVGPLYGEDLAGMFGASDVVMNLSFYHRENFGLSQAEAHSCGVPVVCAAWGGFKDVVRHGETGYLVDAVLTKHGVRVDWATGADYVVDLLRDANLRARMGARAAEWARERFTVAALSGRLGNVLVENDRRADTPRGESRPAPAYEPSDFARRYEEHKRNCGWYAPTPSPTRAAESV